MCVGMLICPWLGEEGTTPHSPIAHASSTAKQSGKEEQSQLLGTSPGMRRRGKSWRPVCHLAKEAGQAAQPLPFKLPELMPPCGQKKSRGGLEKTLHGLPWLSAALHFHNTKSTGHPVKLLGSKVRIKKTFIHPVVINLWNSLPENVVMTTTLNSFKRGLDIFMALRSVNGYQSLWSYWPPCCETLHLQIRMPEGQQLWGGADPFDPFCVVFQEQLMDHLNAICWSRCTPPWSHSVGLCLCSYILMAEIVCVLLSYG